MLELHLRLWSLWFVLIARILIFRLLNLSEILLVQIKVIRLLVGSIHKDVSNGNDSFGQVKKNLTLACTVLEPN